MTVKEQLIEYISMLESKIFIFNEDDEFLENEYKLAVEQLQELENT